MKTKFDHDSVKKEIVEVFAPKKNLIWLIDTCWSGCGVDNNKHYIIEWNTRYRLILGGRGGEEM